MKKYYILFLLILIVLLGCKKKNKPIVIQPDTFRDSITVFAVKYYSDNSFWDTLSRLYSVIYNSKINYRFFDDFSSLADSIDSKADIVLGIDKFYAAILPDTLFLQYRPIDYQYIKRAIRPRDNIVFIPFAYNYDVFFRKKELKNYPKTLAVLQDHDLYNRVIYFNPDNSYLGRDFLLYSLSVYNNLGCKRFWRGIKKSVFSVENNLNKGAKEFMEGKSSVIFFPYVNPIIIDRDYYLPAEGYYCSIQYMAIPSYVKNPGKSKRFVDFMLGEDVQKAVFDSKIGIPVSINVLDDVADKIKLNKKGKNYCDKPRYKDIKINRKYLRKLWKRTMRKKRKK